MDDRLTLAWIASTVEKNLTRRDVDGMSIDAAASALRGNSGSNLPLRVEGQLVYGLAHILDKKARYLLQDSASTDSHLVELFKQFLSTPENDEVRPTALTGLDMDEAALIRKTNRPKQRDLDTNDMSVDLIMRDEQPDLSTVANDDELAPRSDRDLEVLAGLDLDDENDQSLVGDDFGGADFGGQDLDLDVPNLSTSSPREPNTPIDEFDDVPVPDLDESPVPKKRQRKGPQIDDHIDINSNGLAPSKILRPSITIDLDETDDVPSESSRPELGDVEKLLDPQYIMEEMKRRRIASLTEAAPAQSVEEPDDQMDDYDNGFDDGFEDPGDADDNMAEIDQLDSSQRPDSQDYDDDDQAEQDAANARRALKSAVEKGPCKFDQVPGIFNSRTKAISFVEMLGMANRGQLAVRQEEAYGTISLNS